LIRYFTCGPDEVRAWTIRKGTKAPQAAGVIQYGTHYLSFHAFSLFDSSDFENKFVCGEIMTFDDLKEYGSEAAVKAAGKLRQQGKPYESEFLSFPSKNNIDCLQWWTEILLTGNAVNEIDCQEVNCCTFLTPLCC